jgi:hypothetical protein
MPGYRAKFTFTLCFSQETEILSLNGINFLNPTGYVMHQQVEHSAHTVFCIHLRTNSDFCHLQHKLIGFYNRDEKCLLRGTDWVFNNLLAPEFYI